MNYNIVLFIWVFFGLTVIKKLSKFFLHYLIRFPQHHCRNCWRRTILIYCCNLESLEHKDKHFFSFFLILKIKVIRKRNTWLPFLPQLVIFIFGSFFGSERNNLSVKLSILLGAFSSCIWMIVFERMIYFTEFCLLKVNWKT